MQRLKLVEVEGVIRNCNFCRKEITFGKNKDGAVLIGPLQSDQLEETFSEAKNMLAYIGKNR